MIETQKNYIKWKPTYSMNLFVWCSKIGKTAEGREKVGECKGEPETPYNESTDGYITLYMDRTHWTVQFKWVNFTE